MAGLDNTVCKGRLTSPFYKGIALLKLRDFLFDIKNNNYTILELKDSITLLATLKGMKFTLLAIILPKNKAV